jgi:hypothetical protein
MPSAEGSVGGQQLADGSVTFEKLADGGITTSKLQDGSITMRKLAEGSVGGQQLADGSVTFEELADSSVTSLHLQATFGLVICRQTQKSIKNPLVFKTLELALEAASESKPRLHSDRGFQYTSLRFKEMLDEANLKQSMSRVGRCIDNGPMESFWGTLKCEKYYLHTYQTFEQLKSDIDDYE